MSVDRKRKQSVHPAGKKKKKENVDCDPVVREFVEDTRAAEDMMKELNDMVEQSTPPSSPQFTLTTVYDKGLIPPSSVDYMVCPCHDVRLEARQSQKRMEVCEMSHATVFAVLWTRSSSRVYESRV